MLIGSVFLVREIDGGLALPYKRPIHCVSEMTPGSVKLVDVFVFVFGMYLYL